MSRNQVYPDEIISKATHTTSQAPVKPLNKAQRPALSDITNGPSSRNIIRSNFSHEDSYVKNQARYSSEFKDADDIDVGDEEHPLEAAQYVNEIYQYYREQELRFCVDPEYMSRQPKISPKMREILIDWLIDVHVKFNMQPETLFLTINYLDRFLELCPVARNRLQLVGITCLLIAAKYEEMMFPEIRDFVYITDNAYTREEILKMESIIVSHLKFDLTLPTIYRFLNRYLKADHGKECHKVCAEYLAERCLQNYDILHFIPSVIAASCVYLSNILMKNSQFWTPCLAKYTSYNAKDLENCCKVIVSMLSDSKNELEACKRKFSGNQYSGVSRYVDNNLTLFM